MSQDQLYALQSIHRHVQQSMCCVTYLVQVYVDSDMSRSVKVSFMDIWILTSLVIEKDHIKDVSLGRAYCKAVNICKVPSQLCPTHGAERSCVTPIHIHE